MTFTLATIIAVALAAWSLCRQLPAHNVLMAGLLVCGWFWGMECLNTRSGMPFGALPTAPGPHLPGGAPLLAVLFWFAAFFSSRALARRLLIPWRAAHFYGYWLLGLAVLLMLLLNRAIEPAGRGAPEHFWLRQLASIIACLSPLVIAAPWLINKKPAPPPADCQGPAAWFLLWAFCLVVHWTTRTSWPTLAAGLLVGAAFFIKR